MRRTYLSLASLAVLLAAWPAWAGPVREDRWRWSNPRPHGNNIVDLLVTSWASVQVGDAGTVYVQGADGRWAPAITGVTNYLRGVAALGTRLVVVGEAGCILWSDDGKQFQKAQVSPAASDWFESVAASSQRAVAVGDNGSIYVSTNGINWSKTASGTTEWLRGVAFGGSSFVAVGENGAILRAGNTGIGWTKTTVGTAHLNRVRYFGSGAAAQFFAVGTRGAAYAGSSGGTGWASLTSGTTNTLYDLASNDTGLLLVGDQELRFRPAGSTSWTDQITALSTNAPEPWIYVSAYGATNYWLAAGRTGMMVEGSRPAAATQYEWRPLEISSRAWLWDLTVQRGIHVAVGDLATIQTSLDGILWAREVVPLSQTNTVLLGVGGTTNLLLAAGTEGNLLISRAGLTNMTVTNYVGTNIVITNVTFDVLGSIWEPLPSFTTNTLQGVAANGDLYVVCGDRGRIYSSSDGSNFTLRATSTTNFLSSVAGGPDAWVAVGNRGTMLKSGPAGDTWTKFDLQTTNWLYRVRYLGGQYIVAGQNGVIYTSEGAGQWTLRTSGTKAWLNDIAYVDGAWVVVGTQGTMLWSTNLAQWHPLAVPTGKSIYAAAASEGRLLVAGIEGVILRNQVESFTSPVNILAFHRSVASTALPMQTNADWSVYELYLFGGQPDQFFEFQSSTNVATDWSSLATLEIFDPSGTIYLLSTRNLTNTYSSEFYRTLDVP